MVGANRETIDEHFDGDALAPDIWVPSYLAHWSSRVAAAAAPDNTPEGLRLSIPPHHPLWCADTHPEPLRVSCIQSASFSGPVGTTQGPQPFRDGLVVREAQPSFRG
jgi:hypothetical protein